MVEGGDERGRTNRRGAAAARGAQRGGGGAASAAHAVVCHCLSSALWRARSFTRGETEPLLTIVAAWGRSEDNRSCPEVLRADHLLRGGFIAR
jgi:hypothetical protein